MFRFLANLRPEPYIDGFEIFGVEIKLYAIIILCGALLVALYGYYRFAKKLGLTEDQVTEGVAIGLLCGIMGARLYYVIFNHEGITSFWDVINPRGGGLAIHGGVIATIFFLLIFTKVKKIRFITLVEIVVPLFIGAQVIGRWGNFFNQEAFGPIIDSIGGLTKENVINASIAGKGSYYNPYVLNEATLIAQREFLHKCLIPDFIVNQMYIENGWILLEGQEIYISGYYHPTFLYESLMNACICAFMLIGRKYIKHYYVGDSVGVYLIGYGIVRIIIESLRTDPLMIGSIKVAQLISILFVIGGIAFLVLRRVFKFYLESCHTVFYTEGQTMMLGNKEDENE